MPSVVKLPESSKSPQLAKLYRLFDFQLPDFGNSRSSPTMFPMKAVICEQYGGPEVLEIADEIPVPRIGPNGVLVRVRAAGINPLDWKLRKGMMRALWELR